MSELLHPGQHPDADQLNAFAEHVLPEHERVETLAHLAACPECRQIVFLVQRAQEEAAPLPNALSSRTSRLRGWRNLWPVAAAVMCGLLVLPFLHRRRMEAPQKPVIALESKPAIALPSAPPPPPVVPEPRKSLEPSAKAGSSSLAARPSAQASAALGSVNGSAPTGRLASKPSMFDGNASTVDKQSTETLPANSQPVGGSLATPVPPPTAAPLQAQKGNLLESRQEQATVLQSQNQLFRQQANAPQTLKDSVHGGIEQSASQKVSVASAPPLIQTESATLSTSSFSDKAGQAKIARATLPSNRPAASTISNGVEAVAVDSAGDLFVSKDAGVSWQRIARQWTGKAVRVSLASATITRPLSNEPSSADERPSTSVDRVRPATAQKTFGFELVNDSGVTWSSPDGFVWKQR